MNVLRAFEGSAHADKAVAVAVADRRANASAGPARHRVLRGSQGMGRRRPSLLVGSVTDRLAPLSERPVLVVR